MEEAVLAGLRGGDDAAAGMFEPRHCEDCDTKLTVVTVEGFPVLFWRAIFRRLERFGFDVNCVLAVRLEGWITVDDEACGPIRDNDQRRIKH